MADVDAVSVDAVAGHSVQDVEQVHLAVAHTRRALFHACSASEAQPAAVGSAGQIPDDFLIS